MEKINIKCQGCKTDLKVSCESEFVECPACGKTCSINTLKKTGARPALHSSNVVVVNTVCKNCKNLLSFDDEQFFGEN